MAAQIEATKDLTIGVNITAAAIVALAEVIDSLSELLGPPSFEKGFTLEHVELFGSRFRVEGDIKLMQLRDDQQATITFGAPVDKKGNPAPVENIVIEVVDGTSATVLPNPSDPDNKLSALIVGGSPTPDPSTPTAIRISADGDMGEGVKTIEAFVPLLTTSGQAFGFGAPVEGAPEDQP